MNHAVHSLARNSLAPKNRRARFPCPSTSELHKRPPCHAISQARSFCRGGEISLKTEYKACPRRSPAAISFGLLAGCRNFCQGTTFGSGQAEGTRPSYV